jgi:hypothetical protein
VSPAVPSGEGSSRRKEKGIDPRNFGAVPSLIDFMVDDFAAQREALARNQLCSQTTRYSWSHKVLACDHFDRRITDIFAFDYNVIQDSMPQYFV